MSSKLSLGSILLLSIFAISQSYIQELIIYESNDPTASFHTFHRHLPDLTTCYNETARICTRGFWVGYVDRDFEGGSTNLHGMNDSLNCVEASTSAFRSLRHGGNLDTSKSAVSVYPEEGYQGREILVTNQPNGLLNGKSFLFTGGDNWSVYEEQNFNDAGPIVCVQTDPDYLGLEVYGHINVTETLGLRHVGSILRGCDEKSRQEGKAQYFDRL